MRTTDTRVAYRGGHRGARAGFAVSTGTVIIAVVGLVGAGGAFAYFSQHGESATAASVGHGFSVSTDVVLPAGAVLYPGGPKGGFTITVKPSTGPVRITDIAQDPTRPVVVTNAAGCPATVGTGPTTAPIVTLTAQHNLTLDVDDIAVTRNFAQAVSISVNSPSACQGATFEIPVVLTGRSR